LFLQYNCDYILFRLIEILTRIASKLLLEAQKVSTNGNADAKISGNFSYCQQTDQILEFDFESSQLFNSINVLRIHVDEFQGINFKGNSLVVYVNNGQ
jgi:hypothetical protein